MEKRLFKTGDRYHICEDCGAWVPANRYKCDECGGDVSPMSGLYTVSAAEAEEAAADGIGSCGESPAEGGFSGTGGLPEASSGRAGGCGRLSGASSGGSEGSERVWHRESGGAEGTGRASGEDFDGGSEGLLPGQPYLRCTSCGRRFPFGRSSCPECGGIPVPEMAGAVAENGADAMGRDTVGAAAPAHAPGQDIAGAEDTAKREAVGAAEPLRYFTAFLYDDYGRRSKANHSVKLKSGENILGRNSFLLDSRLFFSAAQLTDRIRERYSCISRENVVLTSEKERLTVQYAGEGKSPVRINGIELREGVLAVLEDGDVLRFGEDGPEGCIEVEIHEQRPDTESAVCETLNAIRRDTSESRRQLSRLEESAAAVGRDVTEVLRGQEALRKAMERLTPEELRVREDDREDEVVWEIHEAADGWEIRKCEGKRDGYTDRLTALAPEGGQDEVMGKTIRDFLISDRPETASEEACAQAGKLPESRQFRLYLYQAAFFEGSCDHIRRATGIEDYAAPLSFLGKAVEEFICTEYIRIIFETQQEDFQAFLKKNGRKPGGYLPQGLLVQYLGRSRDDTEEDAEEKRRRIRRIVEAAGASGEDAERVEALKTAADLLGGMTEIRNDAVHAKASERTANRHANKNYMNKSRKEISKVITEEDYRQKKRHIFGCGALGLMHEYYEEVCVRPAMERKRRMEEGRAEQRKVYAREI